MATSSASAMSPRETPIINCVYDTDPTGAAEALLVLLKRPSPKEAPPDKERPAGGQPAGQEGGA